MTKRLRRLIAEQQQDQETDRIPDVQSIGDRKIIRNNRDMPDLKRGNGMVLLMGNRAWVAAEHGAAERGEVPCPVCEGRDLKKMELCLSCNRAGMDGKINYPGLPIGSAMNEGWDDIEDEPTIPTKYQPNEKGLKGGL